MAQKVDWAKYVAQTETKLSDVSLSEKPPVEPEEGVPEDVSAAEASLLAKIIRKGLVESKTDIEIQRKDPKSPLFSVKSFDALNLKPSLLKGVYDMGFNSPSKIQEAALPALLADPPQNLIAQAQSGTGKTAAFVLAMLSRVDPNEHYPQVVCLSPTYELAVQTGEVAAHMSKYYPEIELIYAVRGEELPKGIKLSQHIIIGTPGKVLDWTLKFKVFDIKKIKVFVLDEADVMISQQGHQDQCIRIHKQLNHSSCQMMFFSATYTQEVIEFAEHIVSNPIIIRLKREEESLDNIDQYYVRCDTPEAKYNALTNIYGTIGIGQAIIFCHTRKTASWLATKMSADGHAVAVLHGELTVEQRISVLDRFREAKEKVLITTNVLFAGIDVEQVTIVVNFDLPIFNGEADCETYLHRIGRTGRFGKKGLAINLIDSENSMRILKDIEGHFGKKIRFLNAEDCEEIEKIGQ
ncbi:DEAD-box helicase Dbp80 isoform X1 [Euwallacea similis]|uniref:DEAD-box helicase Dbp80 isoform X1 n=1 Tax=Euwallacea similis TaxID=1736056 RepID=UPI00344DE983